VLGYEHQYRTGDKATLQWGPVSQGSETRNIFPAAKSIDEHTHVLKFDLDYERNGWIFGDSFRGEWTDLNTDRENVSRYALDVPDLLAVDKVHEGWRAFQGANTVRLDRQFKDWLYAFRGYLYSRLTADADFSLDTFNPSGHGFASARCAKHPMAQPAHRARTRIARGAATSTRCSVRGKAQPSPSVCKANGRGRTERWTASSKQSSPQFTAVRHSTFTTDDQPSLDRH